MARMLLIKKTKMKEHTPNKFETIRAWAIFFTILYYISSIVSNLTAITEVPLLIYMLAFIEWIIGPFLIIISWFLCIWKYWCLEFEKDNEQTLQKSKILMLISILLMVISGIYTFGSIEHLGRYITYNRNMLERLNFYIAINIGNIVCWISCLIYSVMNRRKISTKSMKMSQIIASVLLVIFMAYMTNTAEEYIEFGTELIWFEMSAECEGHFDRY